MEKHTKTFITTEINTDTGEVKKKNEFSFRYFDDEKGYLFWLNKESVKTFKGFALPKDLTESETARIYRLSMVTHKNSNLICYRSGNVIRAMNIKAIAGYLNISYRQAVAFINRMISRRIIGKVKVTIGNQDEIQYYLNPIFFFNGKWLNCNLYFLFKTDLDAFLPSWVKEKFNADLSSKRLKS